MLDKTDLSSLELLLYGASAMSPSRLVEGIERIGLVFSQLSMAEHLTLCTSSQNPGAPKSKTVRAKSIAA
jgi:hypothetical protein